MGHPCEAPVRTLRGDSLPRGRGESHRSIRAGREHRPDPDRPFNGPHREPTRPTPPSPARRLAGLAILVVDDDAASLDYFAVALRIAGAAVTTATSAAEALRLVQERRPDVVLTDIAMPGQDGYWLVGKIRALADPAFRALPVVATTAYGRLHSRNTALGAGFVDHLAKPVEPDILVATLARAAGR